MFGRLSTTNNRTSDGSHWLTLMLIVEQSVYHINVK